MPFALLQTVMLVIMITNFSVRPLRLGLLSVMECISLGTIALTLCLGMFVSNPDIRISVVSERPAGAPPGGGRQAKGHGACPETCV